MALIEAALRLCLVWQQSKMSKRLLFRIDQINMLIHAA